jgi:DNA-binding NarL/FixJ family response regulator
MNVCHSVGHDVSDRQEKPRKSIADSASTTRIQFANIDSPVQTILFVDSEACMLEARRLLFETLSFCILTADCENKALSLLRLTPIDAVVVGYPAGDTRGKQIVHRIREAYSDLPIVLLRCRPPIPQSRLKIVDRPSTNLPGRKLLLDVLQDILQIAESGNKGFPNEANGGIGRGKQQVA